MKASLFKRLAAIFYDSFLVFALWMMATALLLPFTGGHRIPPGTLVYQVYLLVIAYLYFDYFWRHGGQTLGMKAWRIRCQGAVTHGQTALRFLGGLLSLITLGLGFVLNWPDKFSGTRLESTVK